MVLFGTIPLTSNLIVNGDSSLLNNIDGWYRNKKIAVGKNLDTPLDIFACGKLRFR